MKLACVPLTLLLAACAQSKAASAPTASALDFADGRVERLLRSEPSKFAALLERAQELRLQILWSEVVADDAGVPRLRRETALPARHQ